MSKSVDETVFDYFNLLLQEPTPEVDDIVAPEANVDVAFVTASPKVLGSKSKSNKESKNNNNKPVRHNAVDIDEEKPLTPISEGVDSLQKNGKHNDLTEHVDVLMTSPVKVETIDNTKQVFHSKPFEQPEVDKASLTRLLSAVSAPTKPTTSDLPNTVSEQSDFEKKLKESAAKVKEAIAAQERQAKMSTNTAVSAQKVQLEDKEINSLADNKQDEISPPQLKNAIISEKKLDEAVDNAIQTDVKPDGIPPANVVYNLKDVLDDEFQVLFFNMAGLTLAVPLVSLGGIVKIERINNIIGRPKWFLGVQPHRDGKVNVVDSCAWVMPEKYTPELQAEVDYQYIVMLEDSEWGLSCESLVNSVKIDKSHVNWREKPGKRPWLAGVVKEQMCAIIHVQALIQMLEAGLGSQDSIDRG